MQDMLYSFRENVYKMPTAFVQDKKMKYHKEKIKMQHIVKSLTYTERFEELSYWTPGYILFDIETTGLSTKYHTIYLIGCALRSERGIEIHQFFAENPKEEAECLTEFFQIINRYQGLISFNGKAFDIRFLCERAKKNHLDASVLQLPHIDIYRVCASKKKLLALINYKQKTIEAFLGIAREDRYNGGELIPVYNSYIKKGDIEGKRLLLLHNYEDVIRMIPLLAMLSYDKLASTNITLESYECDEMITFIAQTGVSLPAPIHLYTSDYDIYLKKNYISGSLTATHAKMYHYLPNYKDYVYLPKEDIAILASLATHIDRANKVKATPATCYVAKEGDFLPIPNSLTLDPSIHFFTKECKSKQSYMVYDKNKITKEFLECYLKAILQ